MYQNLLQNLIKFLTQSIFERIINKDFEQKKNKFCSVFSGTKVSNILIIILFR